MGVAVSMYAHIKWVVGKGVTVSMQTHIKCSVGKKGTVSMQAYTKTMTTVLWKNERSEDVAVSIQAHIRWVICKDVAVIM